VDGKAAGLALANGRLYVSTDIGRVYCFASGSEPNQRTITPQPVTNPYPDDPFAPVYKAAAESIIAITGVTRGYCLVLGAEQGRLAWELAQQTDLNIIGIEPDREKVRLAREAIDRGGLYGAKIVIHEGNPDDLPYANYFANLIVSDSLIQTSQMPCDTAKLARHLKPCGGIVCLGVPASRPSQCKPLSTQQLGQWLERLQLGTGQIIQSNGLWATIQRGPLPGAGKWTHQYAEPGNTACSDDQVVGGSLGLLWFGEPGPEPMVNRHDAAAAPLAINGRLFIQGENVVMAYDSYNGLQLWKRDLPGAMRTRLNVRECGNLAASEDSLFVAISNQCLRLDATTGRTLATYELPAVSKEARTWGYVAYVNGILYGSSRKEPGLSDAVFAIETKRRTPLWVYQGKNLMHTTMAIRDGWFFVIDSSISPEERQVLLQQDKSQLRKLEGPQAAAAEKELKDRDVRLAVALDARTAGKGWARPVDVTDCSHVGVGGGELSIMYRDGILLICGANANGHYWKQFLAGEFARRRLVALSASNGDVLWAKDANYRHRPVIIGDMVLAEPWIFDLRTGAQKTRPHPITGLETPWQFLRPGHHCGAISACPQMLFMRSGYTSYYDLREDSGIRHFAGHRLGCWINAIPANGLALMPEASAGCVCLHPINCTLVLEPRPDYQRWGIYSAGGTNFPVQRLAINFGAPGDRRDAKGQMWFAYPRPQLPTNRAAMGLALDLKTEFFKDGGYTHQNGEAMPLAATDTPWIYSSYAHGLKRCIIPLLGRGMNSAKYTVRLHFAELADSRANEEAFDIIIQGQQAPDHRSPVAESGKSRRAIQREFKNIQVRENLDIELIPRAKSLPPSPSSNILCGMEVIRQ
jgi:outer membrane protein assembly factor BamB